jgi:hypothetical protein
MRRVVSLHGVAAILLLATIAATTYFTVMRFAAELSAQDARYRFERWEAGKVKPKAGGSCALPLPHCAPPWPTSRATRTSIQT